MTWVRHNRVGGTESCIRNLLEGFSNIDLKDIELILLCSEDNIDTFKQYENDRISTLRCDILSENQLKRVIWQNKNLVRVLEQSGCGICLEPVYGKPFTSTKRIPFITTIHDLQAIHYPHYFSKGRVAWMKASWKNTVNTSDYVVAISEYVKQDILDHYNIDPQKVRVIYDAVSLNVDNVKETENIKKYRLKSKQYYYTVSSLFLHKNLKTIILAMAELKRRNSKALFPLVVSGIGGRKRDEIDELIIQNDLIDDVVFTSFVSDEERNWLYKNCKAFLFPSIFEGFGMPPIEAMAMNVPVLTTDKTSIKEVTSNLCNYIEMPLSPEVWADALENDLIIADPYDVKLLLNKFNSKIIASQYIDLFSEVFNKFE